MVIVPVYIRVFHSPGVGLIVYEYDGRYRGGGRDRGGGGGWWL